MNKLIKLTVTLYVCYDLELCDVIFGRSLKVLWSENGILDLSGETLYSWEWEEILILDINEWFHKQKIYAIKKKIDPHF